MRPSRTDQSDESAPAAPSLETDGQGVWWWTCCGRVGTRSRDRALALNGYHRHVTRSLQRHAVLLPEDGNATS